MLEGLALDPRLDGPLLDLRNHALDWRAAHRVVEDSFGGLGGKVRRHIQDVALRGLQHVIDPLDGNAPIQQVARRHLMEQEDGWRRSLDVARDDDLLHPLADLHQLRGAGAGMRLQLATLGPGVGGIVMAHVGEEQAARCPVDDQPQVAADTHRPEVLVLRLLQLVKLHPRRGRVHLKIERGRLHGLLLVARQPRQAVGEGVGDPEIHSGVSTPNECGVLRNLLCVLDLSGLLGLGIVGDPRPPSNAGVPIGGLGLNHIQARDRDVPRFDDRSTVDPASRRQRNVVACDLPKVRGRLRPMPEHGRFPVGVVWVREKCGRFDHVA
mgnify:CR=1 FL=1